MTGLGKGALRLAAVPLALALAGGLATAQEEESWLIKNARIHTLVEGAAPIESGSILIRDGRIVEIGDEISAPAGATVVDASGLDVYPGMMDSVSQLGLTEIGSVSATVDTVELGEMNPHLKAATAVHPSSEHLPVARANGITHAVVAPGRLGGFGGGGAGISGQASIVHLDGWTVEEMDRRVRGDGSDLAHLLDPDIQPGLVPGRTAVLQRGRGRIRPGGGGTGGSAGRGAALRRRWRSRCAGA